MRWNGKPKRPRYDSWHHWFAWYPVRAGVVSVQWVWLETVHRRLICGGLMRDDGYQYATTRDGDA